MAKLAHAKGAKIKEINLQFLRNFFIYGKNSYELHPFFAYLRVYNYYFAKSAIESCYSSGYIIKHRYFD